MNQTTSLCTLLLLGTLLPAQSPAPGTTKDDDAVVKEGPKDPFTGGDEKWMKALGIEAYAPLPWADGLRTTDVEKVLGENRVLWLETAHFRIGCNLGSVAAPQDPVARKIVNGELQRLNKRCGKIPARASKFSAWLRLHLFALRAEEAYAYYAELSGHDAATGTHLGQADKFLLLLFEKKSDLARYLDRFCGQKSVFSQRHFHTRSAQRALIMTAEGDDGPRDEAAVYAQFRFLCMQMLQESAGSSPYWLSIGLAHHYERAVPSNLMNTAPRADESVDSQTQHQWESKVKGRVQHQKLVIPFETLCTTTDFGYFATLQAWARVDFLLTRDRRKFSEFVLATKGAVSAARQVELLSEVYGLEPEAFDKQWRAWVLDTYK